MHARQSRISKDVRSRFAVLLPLLLAAAPADTLLLARDTYVERGDGGAAAATAVIRTYDGRGIESSKAAWCRASVMKHGSGRYTLRQSCVKCSFPKQYRGWETIKL